MNETTTLRARSLVEGIWSALNSATFIVNPAGEDLAITEINFNPHDPTDAELNLIPSLDNDDFEFLEVQNVGSLPISLLGMELSDGVSFEFDDWRFNLRMSNTEPVIRLNVEARGDAELMKERTAEILELI